MGRITASFGVAEVSTSHTNWKSVLETSDQALYQAKKMGRNRVMIFDAKIKKSAA